MHLDGPLTDPEVVGDRLVRQPGNQAAQYLPLAFGQRGEPGGSLLIIAAGNRRREPALREAKALDDGVAGEWLLDEIYRPRLHRLDGDAHVALSRDYHGREMQIAPGKVALHLEP